MTSPPGEVWRPGAGVSWQWQLTGPIDENVEAEIYDVDLFDATAQLVTSLHRKGRRVICYLSAGTYEDWRPDAASFPASVKGKKLVDWKGEQWLDIRQRAALAPIMEKRLDLCRSKGFDGVEFDNVDAYTNDSGFTLSARDQIAYNTYLAQTAHARGLAAGLKNDFDQVTELEPKFEFAITEECFENHECDKLKPFTAAGKAVFDAEYRGDPKIFCPAAKAAGISALLKKKDLGAWRVAC